ncbi:MAG: sigma-70 family polymerase sigma factor [Myxococcaceae bacterium]|nr:sigma-70 family polymerase sigma factor [Myxococcaceae bacterium]
MPLTQSSEHDRSLFARSVVALLPQLIRFFQRQLPNESEDLASQTVLAALTQSARFRGEASVRTFVFRVAHRLLRKQIARSSSTRADDEEAMWTERATEPQDEAIAFAEVAARVLECALNELPTAQRILLSHYYLGGRTRRQIALATSLPSGTVAGRLRRARAELRRAMFEVARSRTLALDVTRAERELLERILERDLG